jgi:hypothetical protein
VQPSSKVPEGLMNYHAYVFAFITHVELLNEGFQWHYNLWEKRGITGLGSSLYVCVWAKLRASCLFFFSNSLSATEHVLK